ncbi:uncharacterized protein TRAVEDRAFT_53645 [Trametes versicolor FP-101664 SS1]|uniref:uncharacterized protein n=1 Tax=Trametes versicolor (strain FP-101664) TaxID=717944 RepID=UPI0004622E1A|nr:uncharacterized protein TRAVEDRAFT_53645 [Trametes versicolor FP-101664 SS1]EIW52221.1 hypothetical protein TRAVEDRAFT_53645 [Trametes versicolor FP-101664 SS1]
MLSTTHLSALTALFLAILAVATPTPSPSVGNGSAGPCAAAESTPQCCSALMPANSTAGAALLGALGAAVGDVSSLVGIACTDAGSSASCAAHDAPVCCAGEPALLGILSLGCLPIVGQLL